MVEIDLKESVNYYSLQQSGLEETFLNDVDKTFERIVSNPSLYAIRLKWKSTQLRAAMLDKFPYLTVYFLDESRNLIIIIAVLHTSRNPNIWKKRI